MAPISLVEQELVVPEQTPIYCEHVEAIREREYPALEGINYLDHAGTTPPSKSLITSFAERMVTNVYGNPHSNSSTAQHSSRAVDDARVRVLQFFNASPDDYDVVFVANATAGIKLAAEGLRDYNAGSFQYAYLADSHTSSVGVRELAGNGPTIALEGDAEVDMFLDSLRANRGAAQDSHPILFEYPGQSNMTGRRYPLDWSHKLRASSRRASRHAFSLLDAASLVSTCPLDLSDSSKAPDFTVLSFYKIFGFPDLGALIVRKDTSHIFSKRRYFGGGTADMVIVDDKADVQQGERQWHAKKSSLHDALEDGTLPIHSIIALHAAFDTHSKLYGGMENVSRHTSHLTESLHNRMSKLKHPNGIPVVEVYRDHLRPFDRYNQGPILTFNLRDSQGRWVGKSDVEKLAAVKNIQLRTGTLCNPGGMARALGLNASEMRKNFEAGQRCGDDNDVIAGKPTGAIRVSLGAMSTNGDIDHFIKFLEEFYVERCVHSHLPYDAAVVSQPRCYVKKLNVYPIKSCGAFEVPPGTPWAVMPEGLAWDRTWCLVHQGTGAALNQKRYPRMALIKPFIAIANDTLHVALCEPRAKEQKTKQVVIYQFSVPLSENPKDMSTISQCEVPSKKASRVCGENIELSLYSSPEISSVLSDFLGVPCTLARFSTGEGAVRYAKTSNLPGRQTIAPEEAATNAHSSGQHQIRLSNESPMLLISQASVNHVNKMIKLGVADDVEAISADVFRANIVVDEELGVTTQHPYAEDNWNKISIASTLKGSSTHGAVQLDVLGSCRRCQMVCIDQATGVRGQEPFATLAKTRKINGQVLFGRHVALSQPMLSAGVAGDVTIAVGQMVLPH